MCLAIYKPAATRPDWIAYANGYSSNPHSWGFAALHDGHLVVMHGLGSFDEFRLAFEPYSDCQALIHYRWATHGNTDLLNCHPFMVSHDLAMIHNGIVSIERNVNKDMSDTWHFNELVLKPMLDRDRDFFLRGDVIYSQQMAHRGNKFCFLRADGEYGIWNEADGEWADDGHWYSNDGYLKSYRYIGYTTKSQTSTFRDMTPPASKERTYYYSSKAADADADAEHDDIVQSDSTSTLIRDPYSGDTLGYYDDEDMYDLESMVAEDHMADLMRFGFSSRTLLEVQELLGSWGIEVLHDCM